jgi:hypothetical protein
MTQNEKRTYWQRHLKDWSKSQLSQKAYCQSQNLSLATFGYWRKRLADATPTRKLIPVATSTTRASVNIYLPGGIYLEVPAGAVADILPVVYRTIQVGN